MAVRTSPAGRRALPGWARAAPVDAHQDPAAAPASSGSVGFTVVPGVLVAREPDR